MKKSTIFSCAECILMISIHGRPEHFIVMLALIGYFK